VSNSRAFRRRLAVSQQAIGKRRKGKARTRYPSAPPSLGTVRRWLNQCVAEGTVERKPAPRTGKPGNPGYVYKITEKGLEHGKERKAHGNPWEEAILVGCPTCKARPGYPCRTLRSRRKRGWWPHDSRMALWKRTVNKPLLAEAKKELAGSGRS
jgi:DNA-binding PadR family transcriptional regulator